MRYLLAVGMVLAFQWEVAGQSDPKVHPTTLAREVLDLVPAGISLDDPAYLGARMELEKTIEQCGVAVVKGIKSLERNKCAYQITLDRDYFEFLTHRTGLLHSRDWAYQDRVTFYEAPAANVPDNFDLRDLMKNGQPVIKQQKCGDCWAWSTHHGLEIARAVHDGQALDYSIQSVLSCSKQGSCGGGYMGAVDFLKKGLPFEADFPYAASDKACKYSATQLQSGWEPKVQGTPYVGSSLDYSLANRNDDGSYRLDREGSKVKNMMAALYQWKSPLVVTVAAYSISGSGVYDSCSAINSGGDHMVAIVGWDLWNGKRVAHVWNSWGLGHGDQGVSRILWECGDGRLNRGLGYSAKIVQYKPECVPPDASQTYLHEAIKGKPVQIGASQSPSTTCSWIPRTGLADPDSCVTIATPEVTTEYHLTAKNDCGTSTSMTLVHVWGRRGEMSERVLTPFGYVKR